MRFLGLIITLAIIGYSIHIYLGSSPNTNDEMKPEQQIDQATQAADLMNEALQRQQDKLDGAN
ncbi:MAG: hypothetical protein WBO73_08400 [Gammaproteobacteria bacterium]|jgi:hypothetical protein